MNELVVDEGVVELGDVTELEVVGVALLVTVDVAEFDCDLLELVLPLRDLVECVVEEPEDRIEVSWLLVEALVGSMSASSQPYQVVCGKPACKYVVPMLMDLDASQGHV